MLDKFNLQTSSTLLKCILAILLFLHQTPLIFSQIAGDVVINEVMYNPEENPDSDGEWFEVVNITNVAIDMNGWEISNGSQSIQIANGGPLLIQPGQFFVFGANADPLENDGVQVDYEYTSVIEFQNNEDMIILENGLIEIDRVAYFKNIWPSSTGVSMALDTDYNNYNLNDNPANWCDATVPYSMDNMGTPGQANTTGTCGTGPLNGDLDSDGILDSVDNCIETSNADQQDTDGDGIGDVCDDDADNDGVANASDSDSLSVTVCLDSDGDSCDDCSVGVDGFGPLADNLPNNDGPDFDGDGLCDASDPDNDNDGIPDWLDVDPLNPFLCADADNDGCDDCSIGVDGLGPLSDNLPNNDGPDLDGDGLCDSGDPDIDNDGVLNALDVDPLNVMLCQDIDNDGCDDCVVGVDGYGPAADASPASDGPDLDGDGLCDASDPDIDGDGIPNAADNCPDHPNPGQEDFDMDGDGDYCDLDFDGDGIPNIVDNCVTIANSDQTDTDSDGWGDVCDNCPAISNSDQANGDVIVVDSVSIPLGGWMYITEPFPDNFGDVCDNCPTRPNNDQINSDADSWGDACDNCPTVVNESQTDSDETDPPFGGLPLPSPDGVGNACDNCPSDPNADQLDFDMDGSGDACDSDADNDGIIDFTGTIVTVQNDNCLLLANANQLNSDSDSWGDACDNCPNLDNADQSDQDGDGLGDVCDDDIDGDGILNLADNCPNVDNANQVDTDADNFGDLCDNCPDTSNALQANMDSDSVGDVCDNCPSLSNEDQSDIDGDGIGDVCDIDPDNDGVIQLDNCPMSFNPRQIDTDDDGVGNVCDNCPTTSNPSQLDSDQDGKGDACQSGPFGIDLRPGESEGILEIRNGSIFLPEGGMIMKLQDGSCVRLVITGGGVNSPELNLQLVNCPQQE